MIMASDSLAAHFRGYNLALVTLPFDDGCDDAAYFPMTASSSRCWEEEEEDLPSPTYAPAPPSAPAPSASYLPPIPESLDELSDSDPLAVLHNAILKKNAASVREILAIAPETARKKREASFADGSYCSDIMPLHLAVRVGSYEIVDAILAVAPETVRKRTDISFSDGTNYSDIRPLHLAAAQGRTDIAGLLVSAGAKITRRVKEFFPPETPKAEIEELKAMQHARSSSISGLDHSVSAVAITATRTARAESYFALSAESAAGAVPPPHASAASATLVTLAGAGVGVGTGR